MKKSISLFLTMTAVLTIGFSACSKNSEEQIVKCDNDQLTKSFVMVDQSLQATIAASQQRNQRIYQDFESALEQNPAKIQEWYEKSQEVRMAANALFEYIEDAKRNLAHMDGQQLKNNIVDYREYICLVLGYREDALKNTIKATLATDAVYDEANKTWVEWEDVMFGGMPAEAIQTLLSKLQNDVRTTEGQMVQYLMNQTDASDVRPNSLRAYVIPESKYVIRGGKYQAQIILAAVDTTQHPEYFVDGVKINDNGIYEVTASGIGKKSYSGMISLMHNGELVKLPFSGEYSVGEPAVTILNQEANIMYRGYDNKFSISVPGVPNDRVRVNVSGASVRQQSGSWIIKPGEDAKKVTITVSAELDGKLQTMGTQEYRVKQLPQ